MSDEVRAAESTSSNDNSMDVADTSGLSSSTNAKSCCRHCKSVDVEFTSDPCECFVTCKKCAMKIATGGKCHLCHDFFTGMKKIH